MPHQIIFCAAEETVIGEAELRQKLAEGLGIPPGDVVVEQEKRLVLGETGMTVLLVLDDNRHPMAATADIPDTARVEHVTRLCKTFRAMGWTF